MPLFDEDGWFIRALEMTKRGTSPTVGVYCCVAHLRPGGGVCAEPEWSDVLRALGIREERARQTFGPVVQVNVMQAKSSAAY